MRSQRRSLPGLQYCPQCLRADITPYFRRCWRLGFVTMCRDHGHRLLDRCPACREPVNFHCLEGDAEAITCCYRCRFDLRWGEAPILDASTMHQRVVAFQTALLEALVIGWYPLAASGIVRVSRYLRVLHHLARLLTTHKQAAQWRATFCRRARQPYFEPRFPSSTRRALEVLSVMDRFRLMLLLAWWLEDWPEHFVAVCVDTVLWARDLLDRMPSPPGWYAHIVQQVLRAKVQLGCNNMLRRLQHHQEQRTVFR